MQGSVTAVISAAGLGSRLGLNSPKCLVPIGGKRLIEHQLDALRDVEDVVIVVGYQSAAVIEAVRTLRRDATITFNHEYRSTGTAASLKKGAQLANDVILSIDGDLIFGKADIDRMLSSTGSCLGLMDTYSHEPVCARVNEDTGEVLHMSQGYRTNLEWSGFAKLARDDVLRFNDRHVFSDIVPLLPMGYVMVDCVEIDYPDDLPRAEGWFKNQDRTS